MISKNDSPVGHGGHPKSIFDYEIIDFIGEGAGSRIYAVSHPATSQLYALKHVVVKCEKDERFVEQLEAEHEIGKAVTHPGLRRSIDLKVRRNLLRRPLDAALVLELFDGLSLEVHPPRAVPEIVDCFVQVARALEAMHRAGYVHCDLKPNNILRSSDGQVKVIDLGQSCKLNTVKKRIQGTPDFIAPEQVKCEPVTPRTDVYNFGATLFWLLTGRHVPTLFTLKRTDNSFLVDSHIESPHDLNPAVPLNLSELVMECVRVNPAKRLSDMHDIAHRLEIIHFSIERAALKTKPKKGRLVPA